MARVQATSLQCPSCGAAIGVKNALKAKSVVCPACSAQVDLTKPPFAVLGTVPRQDPPGVVCLGLRGTLDDGLRVEVIGRIRFVGHDDEESWVWDEWLLLADNGTYLWLQEEDGAFELFTRFQPEHPLEEHALVQRTGRVSLDGDVYTIEERDAAVISYLEGELTWRARVGDPVQFLDTRGPYGGFGAEWTDEEIEYFRRKKLVPRAVWEMLGLRGVVEAHDAYADALAAIDKGSRPGRGAAAIFSAAAVLAFVGTCLGGSFVGTAGAGSRSALDVGDLASVELATIALEAQSRYTLDLDARLEPAAALVVVGLRDPSGKDHDMLQLLNGDGDRGQVKDAMSFVADQSGPHALYLRGAPAPGRTGTALSSVRWEVTRGVPPSGLVCSGVLLLCLALVGFAWSAAHTSGARSRARDALAQRVRAVRDAVLADAVVQGGAE